MKFPLAADAGRTPATKTRLILGGSLPAGRIQSRLDNLLSSRYARSSWE